MRIFLNGMKSRWIFLVFCIALLTGISSCSFFPPTPNPTSTISPTARVMQSVTPRSTATNTLHYTPFKPLLARVVADGPVYVTGDKTVPYAALYAANADLAAMLQHRPDIVVVLRQMGTFTVVASHNERICDLPYFSNLDSSSCQAYGEGGAGGVLGNPITACDERNLLKEPDDPYLRGQGPLSQDICVHELAHTVMDVGLPQADLDRINNRYLAAKQEGLWTGDYAITNDLEFWAVMSQFYFSAGPDSTYSPTFNHVANGPDALKRYDPATFALLDSIYQGSTNLQ